MTKPFDIASPLSDETAQKIDENFNDVYTVLAKGGGVQIVNGETVGIQKGQAVRLIGGDGFNPVVARAKADADSTMPAVGLAAQDIAPKEKGTIIAAFQTLDKLDTSRFVLNDRLYVSDSSAGALTATKPTARAQDVGTVIAVNPTQGKILVAMGGLLSEPHKLLSITHDDTTAATVVRGDLLSGQATTPLWKRLALGSTGTFPRSDGTDIVFSTTTIPDTFNAGDTIVATSSNVLGVVAPVAVGKALISQGTSSPPVWAQINLSGSSSHVTLTLAVGNGGTGLNTSTSNAIIVGAGSSSYNKVAPPAAASLLRFTGTDVEWTADAQLTSSAFELVSGVSSMELRIREPSGGGSNYTGFKAPALAGNVVYTLPTADGSSGAVLGTNGSAVLSWSTPTVGDLLADGSVALTADWDAGAFDIRAATITPDGLTPAGIVFAGTNGLLSEDETNFSWDNSNNRFRVGPNISAFNSEMKLITESATEQIFAAWRVNTTAAGSGFTFGHARGTTASPLTVSALDTLGGSDFRGHDGTAYSGAQALIAGASAEEWAVGSHGTLLIFQTTAIGTTTLVTRGLFTDQGNLTIGSGIANDPSTGDSAIIFADGTIPATLASNTAGLYANDVSGTVHIFAISEAGATFDLNPTFDALGGGVAPTLGTIGGAGPTVAAQNTWMRMNASGTNIWIPVWI